MVVSGREGEVFDLVGEHLTHDEIGERLFISTRTVESHVASLRRKLGQIDHRSLVRLAAQVRAQPPVCVLPQEASSFVGRLAELQEVSDAVSVSRVVSVVGAGGTGKTRLAIRAARDLSIESLQVPVWVDMSSVMSPSEVSATLASALGVVEPGRRTHEEAARDVLGQRDVLMVLDNCEQVLDEIAVVVERTLAACANVTILLTSRIRMAVPHERVVQLGGLDVGSTDAPGAAVELFVERARAGGARIGASEQSRIVDICTALDGTPLAIELAAARVTTIGIDGVENGLGDHRRLLVGGERAQARHRSVSDTLAWSYRLLTRLDQQVLSRVATFRGAFSATDAVSIAAHGGVPEAEVGGALGRLAQHNLLAPTAADVGFCYRALETVRQFGLDQLSADGDHIAAQRHLEWCTRGVADLGDNDRPGWATDVDTITDEVNGALSSTAGVRASVQAHDLAFRLANLLFRRGRITDSQNAFERAAGLAGSEDIEADDLAMAAAVAKCRVSGPDALRLEHCAADKALSSGNIDLAVRCLAGSADLIGRCPGMFDDAPPLERAHGFLDTARSYSSHSPTTEFVLVSTEASLDPHRDLDELEDFVRRALNSGELLQASSLLDWIATRHAAERKPVEALAACRRRLDIFDSEAPGPKLAFELKDALHTAICTATGAGQLSEAIQLAERHALLPFLRAEPGHAVGEGIAPHALAGNWGDAIEAGKAFLAGWEQAGRPVAPGRGIAPAALAMVHGLRSDDDERDTWLETLRMLRGDHIGDRDDYDSIFAAIVALHHNRNEDAEAQLALYRPNHFFGGLFQQWHAALAAEAAVLSGRSDAHAKVAEAISATEHNPIATALSRRASALRDGTTQDFESIAADLVNLGCAYQAARTLTLAGGTAAERGAACLKSLGATET